MAEHGSERIGGGAPAVTGDTTTGGARTPAATTGPAGPGHPDRAAPQDRKQATARQKEQYGGIKVGSAFFGWLTATGTAVLLTALVAAAGTAVGVTTGTGVGEAVGQATQGTETAKTVGIAGGIALLVVLFVAYYCGGYVAGRMARFNGLRQGVAVWLWAVVVAVLVAVLATVAGDKYDVLSQLNSFPRIPVNTGDLTTGGLIALAAVAAASLLGAVLGGLAGLLLGLADELLGLVLRLVDEAHGFSCPGAVRLGRGAPVPVGAEDVGAVSRWPMASKSSSSLTTVESLACRSL